MLKKTGRLLSVVALLSLGGLTPQAFAAPMPGPRDHGMGHAEVETQRTKLQHFVGRKDVQARLQSLGVSPDEASKRLASLSDDQVRRLGEQLDSLPAGGDSTVTLSIGAAILIVILLIVLF